MLNLYVMCYDNDIVLMVYINHPIYQVLRINEEKKQHTKFIQTSDKVIHIEIKKRGASGVLFLSILGNCI